jgi:hypothetical protein
VHSRCGPNAAVATSDAANRFSRSASGKLLGGHASCHSELSPFAFRPSVPLLRRAGIRRAPATPVSGASVPGPGALTKLCSWRHRLAHAARVANAGIRDGDHAAELLLTIQSWQRSGATPARPGHCCVAIRLVGSGAGQPINAIVRTGQVARFRLVIPAARRCPLRARSRRALGRQGRREPNGCGPCTPKTERSEIVRTHPADAGETGRPRSPATPPRPSPRDVLGQQSAPSAAPSMGRGRGPGLPAQRSRRNEIAASGPSRGSQLRYAAPMLTDRQLWSRLAIADVVLFVIASAFNDRSSLSVDGLIWWLAIALFGLLIVAASVALVVWVRSRAKRPRRPRRPRIR